MALKIVTYPNPLLKEKSKKVSVIDDSIKKLAVEMAETLENYGDENEKGVALAAIQVGVPIKMTVLWDEEGYWALLNPEITKAGKEEKEEMEGCMSVPKKYGQVSRPTKVKVKGIDLDGKKVEFKAEGLMARTLCHEIDHMNGKLFLDKVKNNELFKLKNDGSLEKIRQ